MGEITAVCVSSLEKIFPDDKMRKPEYTGATALKGESFSFQVMMRASDWGLTDCTVKVESRLNKYIKLYSVEAAPCGLAAYPQKTMHDRNYISHRSGLFPDILTPLKDGKISLSSLQNRFLWIEVNLPEKITAGSCKIRLKLSAKDAGGEAGFTLKVIDAVLPKQDFLFTQWFHADCLASYYKLDIYSEEHWRVIGNYLKTAAEHGINTILTPVLTPPLDTAVGGQRPCVQLVEITKEGSGYSFDFSRLNRFVDMALSAGITHFEINHLFSQWGGRFAPNIYVNCGGERKLMFGWHTPSNSNEYVDFLRQLLPAVVMYFKSKGLYDKIIFHISDEPSNDDLAVCRRNAELVYSIIGDLPVIDALSSYELYRRGIVKTPVVAINHIDRFIKHGVKGLWGYYCCSQGKLVSNRFLAMPSWRNRIIGLQCWKYGLSGFLHWGFNFWYTQYSKELIDPFRVTDAGGAFPGGDAFSVYPGENGEAIASVRLKVFRDALEDMRALKLLEELVGRERANELIDGYDGITFKSYPNGNDYILSMRERVNNEIEKAVKSAEKYKEEN